MAGMVWLAIFATSRSYIEMDRKIKQVFAMDILQCFIKYLGSLPETVEILTTSRGYEVPSILSVLRRCWLGVRKSIRPVKIERWGVDVVICLEWGTDCLHMVRLMPLPAQLSGAISTAVVRALHPGTMSQTVDSKNLATTRRQVSQLGTQLDQDKRRV